MGSDDSDLAVLSNMDRYVLCGTTGDQPPTDPPPSPMPTAQAPAPGGQSSAGHALHKRTVANALVPAAIGAGLVVCLQACILLVVCGICKRKRRSSGSLRVPAHWSRRKLDEDRVELTGLNSSTPAVAVMEAKDSDMYAKDSATI